MEPFVITFYGFVTLSKKNKYRAIQKRRKGTVGDSASDFYAKPVKDRKLSKKLMYLTEQVPKEYWGVRVLHPAITFRRFILAAEAGSDRTGIWQTLEDILVYCQIIQDDSDIFNNGDIRLLPSVWVHTEAERRAELEIRP